MKDPERATVARAPGLPRTSTAVPPPTAITASTVRTARTAVEQGTAEGVPVVMGVGEVAVAAATNSDAWWVDFNGERFDLRLSPGLPHPDARTAT